MRAVLKDGSVSIGEIVPVAMERAIGWRVDGFRDPFAIRMDAVRSINTVGKQGIDSRDQRASGFRFQLQNDGLIAGELLAVEDAWVTVDSPLLGTVRIKREYVRAMDSIAYTGRLIYSGPMDDDVWRSLEGSGSWKFESGVWSSNEVMSGLVANVDVPSVCEIRLRITWKGQPNFTIHLGAKEVRDVKRLSELRSAARLEIWDNQLAMIRDFPTNSDITLLCEIDKHRSSIELCIYLNQKTGEVLACDANGRFLGKLNAPSDEVIEKGSVLFVNHCAGMIVESLQLSEWDGNSFYGSESGTFAVTTALKTVSGAISGYDHSARTIELQSPDGTVQKLPVAELRQAKFLSEGKSREVRDDDMRRPPAVTQPGAVASDERARLTAKDAFEVEFGSASSRSGGSGESDTSNSDSTDRIELILTDDSRLRGFWLSNIDNQISFLADGLQERLLISSEKLAGVVGSIDRFMATESSRRVGRLTIGESFLEGYLIETNAQEDDAPLAWQPLCSYVASHFAPTASGQIVFRRALDTSRGIATTEQPTLTTNEGAEWLGYIRFSNGDVVQGTVSHVSAEGVMFSTPLSPEGQLASSEQIESVELNPAIPARKSSPLIRSNKGRQRSAESEDQGLKEDSPKYERLLTVPRTAKNDPPTHMVVSITGDMLRGRLLSLNDSVAVLEVRLESVEIPRQRIAKIVWLHERSWEEVQEQENTTAQGAGMMVHYESQDGVEMTFSPTGFKNGVLEGLHPLLGFCRVDLWAAKKIFLGPDVSAAVRAERNSPWILSLATLPKVLTDEGGASEVSSPLVGKPAPPFSLDSLDGDKIRVGNQFGKVVVLDFWASWCPPCMKSMPEIDGIVRELAAEVGSDRLQLVAINVREGGDRASAALERMGISPTVALDTDGFVSDSYQVTGIPQTVIIDSKGDIAHVFIGSGEQFLSRFKEALETALDAL